MTVEFGHRPPGSYRPFATLGVSLAIAGLLLIGHPAPLAGQPATSGAMAPGCRDHNISASAVRTRGDIRSFVECAKEYLAEHGTVEARRAFNEDARWKHGAIYVFVDGVTERPEEPKTLVYPPAPSRESLIWPEVVDVFGTGLDSETYRLLEIVDAGWLYYSFPNPATGKHTAKASYISEVDWNGERAALGAGIYARDLPGTCDPGEVHAAGMAANQSDRRLLEFVRCATLEVESAGFFAGPMLSESPRWKHGSVYVFGVNGETGAVEFSGNRASFATSGRIPELLFGGRDVIEVGKVFGESFWYYSFENPVTGALEPKVAFVKLARPQGFPLLVGSGYNP